MKKSLLTRKLALKQEVLKRLDDDRLAIVQGGSTVLTRDAACQYTRVTTCDI